jgi:branched-chain amino acid transport system substrate-binding protein
VVEKLQMPYVVASAGADDLSQRKRSKWLVRTCYTSSQVSHPLGEYAYKTLGLRKVVCIASDYAYGYEVVGGFQQCFEQAGGRVVQKLWAPVGFTDFTAVLKSIRKDADAIFLCIVGQSAEIIPKQLKELGINKPLIGTTGSFDESFYPRMGDELLGSISASLYSTALNTPANKKFVKEYRAKYGEDPSYTSENGYTAAMWIDKAVESLKGNVEDKEQLLKALKSVELKDAPRGPVKLDQYGTSIDNVYILKVERKNGKLQNTVVFTYPAVSQFWKFNPTDYLKQPIYTRDWPPCKYGQAQ